MTDIKQRLSQVVELKPEVLLIVCDVRALCRDALAEIERLEASHCKAVAQGRQVDALERIADRLDEIAPVIEQAYRDGWGSHKG